jgi:TnpA family transposase
MKRQWTANELAEHWTLQAAERALLERRTPANQLGLALLLKFFQSAGRFPRSRQEVPEMAVAHLARQVGVPAAEWQTYDWTGRTIKQHRAAIRAFLGFRAASVADFRELVRWLGQDVLPHDHREEHLQAAVYQRLRERQIEPPTPERVERLVRSALHTYEQQFCAGIAQRLSPETKAHLDALLVTAPADAAAANAAPPEPALRSPLQRLKIGPGAISLDSLQEEIAKLQSIRALGVPADLFRTVPPGVLQHYRQRIATEPPREVRRHPKAIRYTGLAAFCQFRAQEICDHLVDLLTEVVHRMGARAERRVEKAFLTELRRVSGKTNLLFQMAEAALKQPDGTVRDVLYPIVSEQTLRDLVREYRSTGPAYQQQVQTVLRTTYRAHYRRMLPALLGALEFRSNNERHRPVIRALKLLNDYVAAPGAQACYPETEDVPLEGVVRPGSRALVITRDKEGREQVNRINYELAVLQALRDKLRCKEIWVVGGRRYRNPDEDLPADFETQRVTYYAALYLSQDAHPFVTELQQAMTTALETLDRGLPTNPAVRILDKEGGWISLTPLAAQPEAENLAQLKHEVGQRWPMTSLLDILKETDWRTGFTEQFKSVAARETMDRATLRRRLLLCLYALGTNAGLKRITAGDHGESYRDLLYVRRRFLHPDPLRSAIAGVVNALLRVRLPYLWGEGTSTCASDAKKFGAWDQNLMTEWHVRYRGPGIMVYWHVEKKAACIYSQLKSCSSSEVAAMLEGLLRHDTEITVEKNYVDSHGQSEVAFTFCRLLGLELLPRLKAIPTQRLYRPTAGQPEAFPNLQPVLRRPLDWGLIRQQYDEMIKYATALRLGTANAEAILRRFTRSSVQHPTYRALTETGKALKTIFLCRYLHSEALRQEIHAGLNVVENWNSANSFILFGKGGEIATNRLEEQELVMLSLHLLQLSLVYVNTLMLQQILREEAWSQRLAPADRRALTPLFYSHVNPYGFFRLNMEERLLLDEAA